MKFYRKDNRNENIKKDQDHMWQMRAVHFVNLNSNYVSIGEAMFSTVIVVNDIYYVTCFILLKMS